MSEILQSPFNVIKGISVGPFKLGMPLFEILKSLDIGPSATNSAQTYISYNEEYPTTGRIVIKNLAHSLTLYVDAKKQILICIEIEHMKVQLKRSAHEFLVHTSASPQDEEDTFGKLSTAFNKLKERTINNMTELYDGSIVFQFSGTAEKGNERKKLGLTKIIIKDDKIEPLNEYGLSFLQVDIDVLAQSLIVGNIILYHKEHVEKVTADLGFPQGEKKVNTTGDYFYNYFSRGFDILFDSTTHCIKKFVVHSNNPSDTFFGNYSKCFFNVKFSNGVIVTPESLWKELNFKTEDPTLLGDNIELYQYENCSFEIHSKTSSILTIFI
ncbi:hypothetical protein EHI8A_165180 [Entamoeba histolytica HM-1:IMSS-B]|uniref:Uncharacterized protein n=6 Tax=Entamoeba histolytica TaxID=5759 RepID=C4M4Z8_ENTH1|nr:hypothetical protein, conserved [Entamoeba histolytica HM-1:IMSS]EMD48873.1 Hypothetical protein EHI5A_181960 [Entamoeba histolytica KU27]EMH74241.1 hypothetical protein EHI8A_165180 [Entamoeba histolytica HM-1:IMSS-B]ENY63045.1 hypothetical protein EHI7A_146150 [Entamoeba histolytica HM-1:IMSS-A]GAT96468.1 hypothetical protein conserved [Entamoeba histolytica]EAL50837.1 hypothetical protein, conserved [Entamoeba histolytica HM-1:IMSS]|eukprot:XP_656224.1 hypothetical protein, conserved [Entamoeba histolytica HM-1:IMSS]